MYNKKEASVIRHQFWTTLGQYLSPVPSADGENINWINYKSGVKHVNFKMDADHHHAYLAIELSHNEPATRKLFYDHLTGLKSVLSENTGFTWIWEEEVIHHDKTICRVYIELKKVNIFERDDWPKMISFYKSGIIILDNFWCNNKMVFELLK